MLSRVVLSVLVAFSMVVFFWHRSHIISSSFGRWGEQIFLMRTVFIASLGLVAWIKPFLIGFERVRA